MKSSESDQPLANPGTTVTDRRRLLVSVTISLLTGLVCYILLLTSNSGASDFEWPLRGVRYLLSGVDPYTAPNYPRNLPLFYPLPALLVALPFAWLPGTLAAALFFGISCGLLAWGLYPKGPHRLLVFLSAPFLGTIILAQWSPLLMAACVIPWLLPLVVCKPNLGLMALTQNPAPRWVLLAWGAVVALSFILVPGWPWEWWQNTRLYQPKTPMLPVMRGLLLLAFLHWRKPEGRLLGLLALIPHQPYDIIVLWLIPRTFRQSLVLTMLSWLAFILWKAQPASSPLFFALLIYLPALVMVLMPDNKTPATAPVL